MIDVSIIIVNYNTCQITKECINSIFNYTSDVNFEIILIDNNSKDESYTEFSIDKRIKYFYLDSNLGFGKANNIGFEHSLGKYLFLLNSDTLLKSNAVKEFFLYMENTTPDIGCVGTILKDIENNPNDSYFDFPTLWSGLRAYTFIGHIFNKIGNTSKPRYKNGFVDYISGADLFLRREIIEKYGLFDPEFFMYYEETEMQYRYKKNGIKCVIFDKPQIIHLEGYSVKKSTNALKIKNLKRQILLVNSFCLYLRKTKGYIYCFLFKLLYFILSPLWLVNYKYKFKDRLNYIIKTNF